MSIVARALACGTFVALLPVGLVLARSVRARDVRALAMPLGVAAISLPLALAAALGAFDARWIGLLGWCVALVAALALRATVRKRTAPAPAPPRAHANNAALVVLAAVAAFLYAGFPAETPLGGRDEGLYSLGGMALERAGTLAIARPAALDRAPELFAPLALTVPFHLPGIPAGDVLKPQFSPLLPAWIAALHAVGGDALLYRVNALFALGALAAFYALARRLLRPGTALLAAVAFALEPAQVWSARVNLAEPLGQLLGLGGLLLALDGIRAPNARSTIAAAALLGVACFVRLDMAIVAPLLFAAALACALTERGDASSVASLLRVACATLAAQALAVAVLAAWSPAYVSEHARAPIAALVVSAALGTAALALAHARLRPTWTPRMRARVALAGVAMLCAAFAYAAFVRPHLGGYALIPGHSALAGTRDFREDSLRNLAAYVGWPTLLLALAGLCVAFARMVSGRRHGALALLATLAIGTAAVFVTAPRVSPDHFWAIRRFVTLALPLIVLFAGFGLQGALAAVGRAPRPAIFALTSLAMGGVLLVMQRATLFVAENAGLTAQLRALDARLPAGPLVVRGEEALATTLALGFGREVLPLRDEHLAVDAATRAFWQSCATTKCTLIHGSFAGLRGLQTGPTTRAVLTRRYIAPTHDPLPRALAYEASALFLTPVSALDPGTPPRNAGAMRDWRVDEHGFYRDEASGGSIARWTDGDAELVLPAWPADALEVRLAVVDDADVGITLDGAPLFAGRLGAGEHVLALPLPSRAAAPRRLRIESSTFVPRARDASADPRTLGVLVRAIRLIDRDAAFMTAASPPAAYRSTLSLVGGDAALPPRIGREQSAYVQVDIANRSDAVWPARNDPAAGETPVALGIVWTREGDAARALERRVELPYSLRPGEIVRVAVPLAAGDGSLGVLAEGDYRVRIGLVHEGVAWFWDRGEPALEFPVRIVP